MIEISKFKIYLSGKMGGLPHEEYTKWRNEITILLTKNCKNVQIFDPAQRYNYEKHAHQTEKEVMRYELRQVLSSDLVILKLDGANTSVGTMFEVAYAFKNNIPSIGIAHTDKDIHTWLEEACDRIETSHYDVVKYIREYYLN